uniref:Ig-like domain-containing protein n=1 Tax=Myripristis murdjan TaxID=586833 RepID=A0A667ZX04_9TELE
ILSQMSCFTVCMPDDHSNPLSDLRVQVTPSAEVTEGQRVTLTCSTSCPLADSSSYIWYHNSRALSPPESHHKQLLLDPVSRQHAGNYSCAVSTHRDIKSPEETLTVKGEHWLGRNIGIWHGTLAK